MGCNAASLKMRHRAKGSSRRLRSFLNFSTFPPERPPHQHSPSEFNYPWVFCLGMIKCVRREPLRHDIGMRKKNIKNANFGVSVGLGNLFPSNSLVTETIQF